MKPNRDVRRSLCHPAGEAENGERSAEKCDFVAPTRIGHEKSSEPCEGWATPLTVNL